MRLTLQRKVPQVGASDSHSRGRERGSRDSNQRPCAVVLTAAIILLSVWPVLAETATGSNPPTTASQDKPAAIVIKAPVTIDEIRSRRDAIAKETADRALTTTTLPTATQPVTTATQPADVATNLWFALNAYRDLLDQQAANRKRLAVLKSDESLREIKEQTAEFQAETKKLEAKIDGNQAIGEAHTVGLVRERYEKLNGRHDAQVKAQTAREERINGIAERRKAAGALATEARKRLDDTLKAHVVRTTTAKAKPGVNEIRFARRLAEIEVERALAEAEELALEEQLLTLEHRREERLLATMTPNVQTLRRWMNALEDAAAQGELKRIEWYIASARKSGNRQEELYWQSAKLIQEAVVEFEKYDNKTRDRFPESVFGKLESTITRDQKYWRSFIDSLSRRSGQEVLSRYKRVRKDISRAGEYDGELADKLDLSVEEREEVYLLRDKVTEQVDAARDELRRLIVEGKQEADADLETQLDERRAKLTSEMDGIMSLQEGLIGRLGDAVEKHGQYVDMLDRTRSRLYWSYLMVQDQGLASLDLPRITKEWSPGLRQLEAKRQSLLTQTRRRFADTHWSRLVLAAAVLLACIPAAWLTRRRFSARSLRFEKQLGQRIHKEGIVAAGISERLKLACMRFLGNTALLVVPLVAILACLLIVGQKGDPSRFLGGVIAFILLIRTGFGLVRALFLPGRPRFRLIRCSNKVAQHYRRWLHGLLYLTIVATPVPLILFLADAMPATQVCLWQVYKTVALLMALLFLLRKQLVLRVVGRPEDLKGRWLYSLIAGVFPLIQLATLALLVLEILGYSALTTYLIRNVQLTFALLLAATVLTRYASDLAGKHRREMARQRAERQSATIESTKLAGNEGQEIALVDEEEPGESEFFVSLAAIVSNWLVRLAGLVLILGVWGITLVEIQSALTYPLAGSGDSIVTLWRVVAVVLVVIMVRVASRFLRSLLTTRVYPNYETLDRGARAAINTLLHYVFIVVGVYAVMQLLYVNLGALTVLVGTVGLGLGLGLQPLFINFISGLMIFLERHIKVGDIVEVSGRMGEVTGISMRSTSIKTFDNIDLVIPNADFITSEVVNWSLQDRRIRGNLTIGVAYGSDVELVRELLLRVAKEHPMVLRDPAPSVWFTDFGDNALAFRLNVWFEDLSNRMSSLTDMRFTIDKLFAERKIDIPFPQRTLSTVNNEPIRVEITDGKAQSNQAGESQNAGEPPTP